MKNLEELLRKARGTRLSVKSNFVYKNIKSNKQIINNNSNKIVVKVTGGANTIGRGFNHVEYDSKDNTVHLFTEDNIVISKEEAKKLIAEEFSKHENKEHNKKTYRLVFSMKEGVDEEKLKEAVLKTIKEKFENHDMYCALHTDTNHKHIHVTVCKTNKVSDKRLNLNKSKLNEVKVLFAQELNKLGVKAEYKSITDKTNECDKLILAQNKAKLRKHKRELDNTYKVLNFGHDNYLFDKKNKNSFFIEVESLSENRKVIWNKKIENEVNKLDLKIGEYITLKSKKTNEKYEWMINKIEENNLPQQNIFKIGEVVDFGKANYRFDKDNKESFFIRIQTKDNQIQTVWNKKLEEEIKRIDLQQGERVRIFESGENNITCMNISKALDDIQRKNSGMKI